jgi:hypothetical protein
VSKHGGHLGSAAHVLFVTWQRMIAVQMSRVKTGERARVPSDRGVAGRSAGRFVQNGVNNLGVIISPIRMTDALQTTAAGSFLYRRRHGFCGRCFLKIRRPGNPFWA